MTRYELLDRIGVGGMAEIFRGKAVAAGGFEKPVAIKRILPHLSQDKRFVELLIAEAKVLSMLKHRNIVQIFDVGLGDDGQYFLVMEYVDGKDLGAIQRGLEARRRKLSFDLALHIAAEICEALEHAHTARAPDGKPMGLVHRDVSPSNVLLSRAGEVKLTDFGIAKRAESEATRGGGVKGKFAYISPEQARNEQIGPRSDVFSVGILLWELVCNRRLFSGLADLEALRAVREPTNIQRPTAIDPSLPGDIDRLVMASLSREHDKRPTAGQLGKMLRGLRYSLESTVGDPATELARVIDTAEQVERQSPQVPAPPPRGQFDSMDPGEMTVIRIRTADAFSRKDEEGSISMARQVIDRFEEEETRLAQLSGEQLRMLRSKRSTDSGELETATPPRPKASAPVQAQGKRSKRPTDEPTIARGVIDAEDELTVDEPTSTPTSTPSYPGDEATKLVVSRDRRTPMPQRTAREEPPRRTAMGEAPRRGDDDAGAARAAAARAAGRDAHRLPARGARRPTIPARGAHRTRAAADAAAPAAAARTDPADDAAAAGDRAAAADRRRTRRVPAARVRVAAQPGVAERSAVHATPAGGECAATQRRVPADEQQADPAPAVDAGGGCGVDGPAGVLDHADLHPQQLAISSGCEIPGRSSVTDRRLGRTWGMKCSSMYSWRPRFHDRRSDRRFDQQRSAPRGTRGQRAHAWARDRPAVYRGARLAEPAHDADEATQETLLRARTARWRRTAVRAA